MGSTRVGADEIVDGGGAPSTAGIVDGITGTGSVGSVGGSERMVGVSGSRASVARLSPAVRRARGAGGSDWPIGIGGRRRGGMRGLGDGWRGDEPRDQENASQAAGSEQDDRDQNDSPSIPAPASRLF